MCNKKAQKLYWKLQEVIFHLCISVLFTETALQAD